MKNNNRSEEISAETHIAKKQAAQMMWDNNVRTKMLTIINIVASLFLVGFTLGKLLPMIAFIVLFGLNFFMLFKSMKENKYYAETYFPERLNK